MEKLTWNSKISSIFVWPIVHYLNGVKVMNPEKMTDEDHKKVTPLDLLNNDNYTTREIRDGRYETCLGCERLIRLTRTCKECGCFMSLKTWLKYAECPIGKWGAVNE